MIHEIADKHGLTATETTTAANGYPQGLRYTLTDFDSISQLKTLSEQLTAEGREVEEVILHKRDGWQLWSRSRGSVTHGMFRKQSSGEWTIDLLTDTTRCNTEQEAFDLIAGGREFTDLEEMRKAVEQIDNLKEEFDNILSGVEDQGQTSVTVFYDPDQNYRVNYYATDETTGYSYDTHHYKVGLIIF